jgi:hypothetical protein
LKNNMMVTDVNNRVMQELADRIYIFIETYAQVSPDYDGTNKKYTNVDVLSLLACADSLMEGKKPKECFSSWYCSGAYQPHYSKEGKKEHDYLIKEIIKIRKLKSF